MKDYDEDRVYALVHNKCPDCGKKLSVQRYHNQYQEWYNLRCDTCYWYTTLRPTDYQIGIDNGHNYY